VPDFFAGRAKMIEVADSGFRVWSSEFGVWRHISNNAPNLLNAFLFNVYTQRLNALSF